jgi:membrane-bound serine protease (ClpP class)
VLVGAAVAALAAAIAMNKYLPHTPMFKRMLLAPPSREELSHIARRESLAEFAHLVGQQGVATTPLLPAGKARFGEQIVDVIADAQFIDRGQSVVVIQARGNRVLVRIAT